MVSPSTLMTWLVQRFPALRAFWDLEKSVLHEIHVSGTVVSPPTNTKIPHLHVHKPKTMVVETVLVIFVSLGAPVSSLFGTKGQ